MLEYPYMYKISTCIFMVVLHRRPVAGSSPARCQLVGKTHRWAIRGRGRLDRRTHEEVAAARSPTSLALPAQYAGKGSRPGHVVAY
jgi:hypothetical protein